MFSVLVHEVAAEYGENVMKAKIRLVFLKHGYLREGIYFVNEARSFGKMLF